MSAPRIEPARCSEKRKSSDVVDASVVDLATTTSSDIVTTDATDIRRLIAAAGKRINVHSR